MPGLEHAEFHAHNSFTSRYNPVTGASNVQNATKNRLTISVQIDFKNRITEKSSFTQTFTRFSDFDATQILQNVENQLIDDIGTQLADDIFNKAFVNW